MPLSFHEEIIDFKIGADCIIILSKKGDIYKLGKVVSSSGPCETFAKIAVVEAPIKNIFSGMNCFFALNDLGACYGWGDNSCNQITGINEEA